MRHPRLAFARAILTAGLMVAVTCPLAAAQATNTPTVASSATVAATTTPAPTSAATTTATGTAAPTGTAAATGTAAPAATATPNASTHDSRYLSQTGFRVDNDTFWGYFNGRGGLATFGYPTSRTFQFLGFTSQFFQRRIMQLAPDGSPRLLNLFDQGLFPFTSVNGSSFPAPDPSVQGAVPSPSSPTYSTDVTNFIQQNAPNTVNGRATNYWNTFLSTVTLSQAFPNGNGDAGLLPGFNLEMWGAVTSRPSVDPANTNFIYLRFQRGIMMFDGSTNLTQGVLLADYFKAIITGINIPPDLNLQAQSSSFYKQYNNGLPNGLNNPAVLPGTNLQFAFDPQ